MEHIDDNTLVVTLTVGQMRKLFSSQAPEAKTPTTTQRQFAYGLDGIAKIFNCSKQSALRYKNSGRIDGALTQIGRKIIVDVDMAIELAGRKSTLSNTRALEKKAAGKLKVGNQNAK